MTNSNILLQPLEKTRNVNDELASFRQTTGDERVPHSWYAPVPSPHKETALGAGRGGGITQNEMRFCVCPNLISEEHDPLLRGSRRHACFPDTDLVNLALLGALLLLQRGFYQNPLGWVESNDWYCFQSLARRSRVLNLALKFEFESCFLTLRMRHVWGSESTGACVWHRCSASTCATAYLRWPLCASRVAR
jgi:hypothetical protein